MAQANSLYNRYAQATKKPPAKPSSARPYNVNPRQPVQPAKPQPKTARATNADAQRYQQQARTENEGLYARWRAVQAQEARQPTRPSMPTTAPDPMARQARADAASQQQSEKAMQASADRMYRAAGITRPDPDGRIFGVHYGPNWTRGEWTPPPDWRMGKYADIQMSYDEYIRRRNAMEPRFLGQRYTDWINSAKATPNQPHDIYSDWRKNNPRPGGFYQTDQEYILRQNAAPTGFRYTPYGSSYEAIPTQPSANAGGTAGAGDGQGGGGGGWGGWDDWGGGGGGGGGGDYPAQFWNNFLNWRVLEVQGG